MFASRAAAIATLRRALPAGSPPPMRADTVSSLMTLVKSRPFAAPTTAFARLIFDQRLWPDMTDDLTPQEPLRLIGVLSVGLDLEVPRDLTGGHVALAVANVHRGEQQERVSVVRV